MGGEIQVQPIDVEYTQVGQNAEALRADENMIRQTNAIPISGGLMPTKRDANGNVLLYEDPKNANTQLEQPDQWVSIPVVKPDYDDEQAIGVLDAQINELYKGRDITEIQRLRQQVENLRQRLGQATSFGDDIEEEPIKHDPLKNSDIPSTAIQLEDFATGILSETNISFTVNTAIWNSDNEQLEQIGSPSEFPVTYYLIKKEPFIQEETGDSILTDFSDGTKTINAPFQILKADSGFIGTSDEYNVALLPDNSQLSNFYGWFYKDTSTGKNNNWRSISTETNIRIDLMRRRNSGNESIDQTINNYDFIIAFKDFAPPPVVTQFSTLNMQVAFINTEGSFDQIGALDQIRGDYFNVTTFSRETGERFNQTVYRNPRTIEVNRTTTSDIWIRFDRTKLPSSGVEGYTLYGWYEFDNALIRNWTKLQGNVTTLKLKADFEERTIVAGYTFTDTPESGGSGVPDKGDGRFEP